MINVGIDVGAESIKVAVANDGKILALAKAAGGFDLKASTEELIEQAFKKAGLARQEGVGMVATGGGRKSISTLTETELVEFIAAAKGAYFFSPRARVVIDIGANEGRAVSLDNEGKVRDFVRNDRCAAGSGTFVEAMARALKVTLDEFIQLSLASTQTVPINAQCVIFAESEVVSLIHSGYTREDIANAIHHAIAERITAMVRRLHIESDVVLIGGVANNIAFVNSLKETLKEDIVVPPEPEYVSAIGAAISSDKGG